MIRSWTIPFIGKREKSQKVGNGSHQATTEIQGKWQVCIWMEQFAWNRFRIHVLQHMGSIVAKVIHIANILFITLSRQRQQRRFFLPLLGKDIFSKIVHLSPILPN